MHEIKSENCSRAPFETIRRIDGFPEIEKNFCTYLSDESKYSGGTVDALFFPRDEAELSSILKSMNESKTPVTLAGARTGLVGGAVALSGVLISLERFNEIRKVYFDECAGEWRVRADCGICLRELNSRISAKNFTWIEKHGDQHALEELNRFQSDPHGYFYPPDPTELSASLGGTVATNASGAATYRYGSTRNWIRRLRVMLANGEVLDIPRGKYFASPEREFVVYDSQGRPHYIKTPSYRLPETKNTAGIFSAPNMDLIDLFIGSEGVFGAITSVEVALHRRENKISIIQFTDSDEMTLDLVDTLKSDRRIALDFIEFYSENALELLRERQRQDPKAVGMPTIPPDMRSAVFFEFSFDPESNEVDYSAVVELIEGCGADIHASWAGYEPRELERFKVFRHILPETVNAIIAERKKQHPGLHKLGTDLAVPQVHFRRMWHIYQEKLTSAGLQWLAFGHIGNNHIHVNILPRDTNELDKGVDLYRDFAVEATRLGGTVSAEHGIGKIKIPFLPVMFGAEQLLEMYDIKCSLDPHGILNQGDIFEVGK